MTIRTEVVKFAKFNHFTAKPMSGGVVLHKTRSGFNKDFTRVFDSWEEVRAYLVDQVEAVKAGKLVSFPWEV